MSEATDRIDWQTAMTRGEAADLELRANRSRAERSEFMNRPSVIMRPSLQSDDNAAPASRWRASLGALKAYGASPDDAFAEFDRLWHKRAPGHDVPHKYDPVLGVQPMAGG